MATKKSAGAAGGILVFLGSLIYLYVIFTWYGTSGTVTTGSWLASAQFLTPFVIAAAIFSSIALFFMSIGAIAGKMDSKKDGPLWKLIMWGALMLLIVSGGTQYFWYVVVGLVLTYIGGIWEMMM
jgi:hypothetical protein